MVPSHSQGSPPQRSLFGGIDGGILRDYCKEIDAQQIVMSWQKIPPPLPKRIAFKPRISGSFLPFIEVIPMVTDTRPEVSYSDNSRQILARLNTSFARIFASVSW